MHPLEALGLELDADERAIKRAYAQRLKVTRPDEDPAGFQKLHEVYQAALAFLTNPPRRPVVTAPVSDPVQVETWTSPEEPSPARRLDERASPSPWPVWAPPVAPPAPDLDALIEDLIAQLHRAVKVDAFRAWLEERLADWPITHRLEAAPAILQNLRWSEVDVTPGQLEALIRTFNFDDVQSRCDAVELEALRRRARGDLLSPHAAAVFRRVQSGFPTWLRWILCTCVVAGLVGWMVGG